MLSHFCDILNLMKICRTNQIRAIFNRIILIMSAKLDEKIVEEIIAKAKEYTKMSQPLTAEAAILRASREFEKNGFIKSSEWSAYKNAAEKKLLSRTEKIKEAKHKEMLRGAHEAAWARRDAEVEEAEEAEERLSEIRSQIK